MARLSKIEAKRHAEAVALLAQDQLSDEDREFVLEHWQESANHVNSAAGAFFTPAGLARDLCVELSMDHVDRPVRIVDLCAGIGGLSLAAWWSQAWHRASGDPAVDIVCVELNRDYVEVGRKMLPQATWVEASVFDLPELGRFDFAISNPPFGKVARDGARAPRYSGGAFEYHVIDVAADLASWGVFIVPQQSAPFRYSGVPCYVAETTDLYDRFHEQTGITLGPGCGVDTTFYRDAWKGVSPTCEIVVADFTDRALPSAVVDVPAEEATSESQLSMFEVAS